MISIRKKVLDDVNRHRGRKFLAIQRLYNEPLEGFGLLFVVCLEVFEVGLDLLLGQVLVLRRRIDQSVTQTLRRRHSQ